MSGHTGVSWGCLPTTRRCESRGRVTPENTDQSSIVLICGGNAEIDSLSLVVGRFVDDARAGFSAHIKSPPNRHRKTVANQCRALCLRAAQLSHRAPIEVLNILLRFILAP